MSLIHIGLGDLAISLAFMVAAVVLSRLERLGLERTLLIGTVRSVAQLLAVGYVLKAVFDVNRWYWVVLALAVMTAVAAHTARRRQTVAVTHGFWAMAAAIGLSGVVVLGGLVGLVLRVHPWYEPQYVIPLAGIILAGAMNASALSVDRFLSDLEQRRPLIEAALVLGASAKVASQTSARAAVRAGMMPTVNTLMIVGIVQLPGMMTGQILGGVTPIEAVRYQIVILFGLAAGAIIASLTALALIRRQAFNRRDQLIL